MARVSRANAKLLSSLMVYPVTWTLWGYLFRRRDARHPWLAAMAAGPICGWATMYTVERCQRFRRAQMGWQQLADHRAALDEVRSRRAALVSTVESASATLLHRTHGLREHG